MTAAVAGLVKPAAPLLLVHAKVGLGLPEQTAPIVADDIVVAPAGIVTATLGTVQEGTVVVVPPPGVAGVHEMFRLPDGSIPNTGAEAQSWTPFAEAEFALTVTTTDWALASEHIASKPRAASAVMAPRFMNSNRFIEKVLTEN